MYLERRRECGFQLYDSVGIARGDREAAARQAMENHRLFGAPHAMIVTTDEALGVSGVLDCGAWVNNFMLAARNSGAAFMPEGNTRPELPTKVSTPSPRAHARSALGPKTASKGSRQARRAR